MLLTAVVTKDELTCVIESFTPMRIHLDARRRRVMTVGRPRGIDLVPAQGVRVRGDARIDWELAGVGIPVTIQSLQILFVPRVILRESPASKREGVHVLAFEPVIEQLDLKLVPTFLGDKIVDAIREGIVDNRDRIAWDFTRTLSKRLPLPARIGPARAFELAVVDGAIDVTASELRLTARFEERVEKRVPASRGRAARVAAANGRAAAR